MTEVPDALNKIVDVVLAYRPKPKTKAAKKREKPRTKESSKSKKIEPVVR